MTIEETIDYCETRYDEFMHTVEKLECQYPELMVYADQLKQISQWLRSYVDLQHSWDVVYAELCLTQDALRLACAENSDMVDQYLMSAQCNQ